jgi:hypothetical protein
MRLIVSMLGSLILVFLISFGHAAEAIFKFRCLPAYRIPKSLFAAFLAVVQHGRSAAAMPGSTRMAASKSTSKGSSWSALESIPSRNSWPLSYLDAESMTHNIDTAPVPVGPNGDARIRAILALPTTCLAPIVFVRAGLPTNTRWFAVRGSGFVEASPCDVAGTDKDAGRTRAAAVNA